MEVKTPLIIKEILGEEIYELFEKYRRESVEERRNRTTIIWTSPEGKRLFEEAIKEEYGKTNKGRDKV